MPGFFYQTTMLDFEHYNPTRIVFGKGLWARLPELLKAEGAQKILLVYGGGSIVKTGLHAQLMTQLKDYQVCEFGGVEANPDFDTLMKAVEVGRSESVDFILAVGGGSVIDGVKFISGAMHYAGDPWEVLDKKEGCNFTSAVPFGTVLTLPATGSEANSGAVISRRALGEKRVMGGPLFFPRFSFCDPSLMATLPPRQLANGIIDAYVHTLEQYITWPTDSLLQERQAEAILSTLIEVAPVVRNPADYRLASNLMWCATHALNGNLRAGVPTDWCTHMIGHELTALYGIDHAQTLAIILPRLYENRFKEKKEKLAQYGRRVWKLTGETEEVARQAIQKTEAFFQELGVATHLSEYTTDFEGTAARIAEVFNQRGWTEMGERKSIRPFDVESIVAAAY
jgi:NADP-dependent alcohol dehydrogenase